MLTLIPYTLSNTLVSQTEFHVLVGPAARSLWMFVEEVAACRELFDITSDDKTQVAPSFSNNLVDSLWIHLLEVNAPIEITEGATWGDPIIQSGFCPS